MFIKNFEIGCIEFNKIFIQFENTGIDNGFANPISIQCKSGAKLDFFNLRSIGCPPCTTWGPILCQSVNPNQS